ncbi:MAG: 50S ribosome-binding GTPase [Treponema sp.]|nr:50S ribosome-binding GTPase [Treponema sp.]
MNEELQFHQFAVRKDDIQKAVVGIISAQNKAAANELEQRLADYVDESKLKIAFVGQHNSGKSTIVSALTGNRHIKISNNVETDVPADYAWEGVLLTDTPGLYAGKKETHDTLSLQKIKESDLLVFCITSSLFDDLLMKNFVALAYKQAYQSKIYIVVNKMSQENGEFDQLVKNYTETLAETLSKAGGDFADFPVSFIDAHDYIEGVEDSEPELIAYSHFNAFIVGLNDYISRKKLFAKLDTPCRMMISAVDEEIANTSTELDKNMLAVLRQAESVVRRYKKELQFYMDDAGMQLRNAIMAKANALIAKIGSERIEETACDAVNKEIQMLSEKKIEEIQQHIEDIQEHMITDIGDIVQSDIAAFVMEQIDNEGTAVDMPVIRDFSQFVAHYNHVSELVSQGGNHVLHMVGGADKLAKASMVSGSSLHGIVLKVGHFFGASFKPWQAVHIASQIGKVATVLGPALSVVAVLITVGTKVQEEKQIKEIQSAKEQTFNQFSQIASDIITEIQKQYEACKQEVFDAKTKEIDDIRNALIRNNNNNSDYVERLKRYRNDLRALIDDIATA